jgi:hypothetical protein
MPGGGQGMPKYGGNLKQKHPRAWPVNKEQVGLIDWIFCCPAPSQATFKYCITYQNRRLQIKYSPAKLLKEITRVSQRDVVYLG